MSKKDIRAVIAVWLAVLTPSFGVAAETPRVAIGVTEPRMDVLLSAPVPGILTAQHYREGDFVKRGEVILELDKRLEELEVQRRKVVVDLRKMDLDATRTLFESTTGVPKEELDKKEADYRVAVVEHEMANEQLRRRLVVAPFDGVITQMPLDVGEATDAYEPLIRFVDARQCRFECNLEARDAVSLKLNQIVRLRLDTGADPVTVDARVIFLSPVADKASGLINMKALFDNPEGTLRPGLAGQLILINPN